MEYKDYYRVLGVAKTATAKEIKSAFRRLARQYHPDVNTNDPSAEARFKEINEAHEVLGDPEKRQKYDRLGSNWQAYEQWQRAGSGAQGGAPFDFSFFTGGGRAGSTRGRGRTVNEEELGNIFGNAGGAGSYSDFFRTFFGGGGGPAGGTAGPRGRGGAARAQAGEDIEHEVEISLREAFEGTTRLLHVTQPDGTTRRIEAKIPAGATDGTRIRLSGQGGPGRAGGPAGALFIRLKVTPDPRFKRQGDDLLLTLPVLLTTAMLGGEVRVPTLAGDRYLRIPPETANGRRFRLTGQGMPRLNRADERGDLYVEIHIQLPSNLSPRQRELFQELARLEEDDQNRAAS